MPPVSVVPVMYALSGSLLLLVTLSLVHSFLGYVGVLPFPFGKGFLLLAGSAGVLPCPFGKGFLLLALFLQSSWQAHGSNKA